MDNGTIQFLKNGVSLGTYNRSILDSGSYYFVVADSSNSGGSTFSVNFGQRPFTYTAPSGYKALCTSNLPTPTIADGSAYMDVALYTGNGSTQTISGLGFSPDLIWIKKRSGAEGHLLSDTVRGIDNGLYSNQTAVENNYLQYGKVSAVTSSSFTVATTTNTPLIVNESGSTYVAWTWDAGSSTVSNVRANTTAGFSIVTYTGDGTDNRTISHNLGSVPGCIIVKRYIGGIADWYVYHRSLGANLMLRLNTTTAEQDGSLTFPSVPTSTTFEVSRNINKSTAGSAYVAYCFAPVEGYSAFGSFTANASTDGPFVYLAFRPALVVCKKSSGTGTWFVLDSARDPYNVTTNFLEWNDADAEVSSQPRLDFVSNGFKVRTPSGYTPNEVNGDVYVYMAFAEHPFKTARAR
jgi:hypothetical protein